MITSHFFRNWLQPRRNDLPLPKPAKRAIVAAKTARDLAIVG